MNTRVTKDERDLPKSCFREFAREAGKLKKKKKLVANKNGQNEECAIECSVWSLTE